MGTLLWRRAGNGRSDRLVIQWFDAQGVQRQETIRAKALDGAPLSRRTLERDGRRRLAEHELEVDRQRAGLAPITSDVARRPLRWLFEWWWEHRGCALKSPAVRPFLEKHLSAILDEPLAAVTSARIARLVHTELDGKLAPKSRKHVRGYLFSIFEAARLQGGPWHGRANPVEEVAPVKVPKVPRYILQADEMEPVLAQVAPTWRGPVAVALYAGLREGEIFGLLKRDVDLQAGLLMVWRSWDSPRTKDAKALPVPIPAALRPHVEQAMQSPGELLFPDAKGRMRPRELRLGKPLRAALARAGLVVGYEWRCRAWRCSWRERRPGADVPPACPSCGKATTWAKPIPRPVRFHDTRHSYGTQLVRAAGLKAAQQALRHSDIRLTSDTYGHLDVGDLRRGVLAAFPDAPPPPESTNHPVAQTPTRRARAPSASNS
jgi:integrase